MKLRGRVNSYRGGQVSSEGVGGDGLSVTEGEGDGLGGGDPVHDVKKRVFSSSLSVTRRKNKLGRSSPGRTFMPSLIFVAMEEN